MPFKAVVPQFVCLIDFFNLRAFYSYFKVREIVNTEKVMTGVGPTNLKRTSHTHETIQIHLWL